MIEQGQGHEAQVKSAEDDPMGQLNIEDVPEDKEALAAQHVEPEVEHDNDKDSSSSSSSSSEDENNP